MIDKSTLSLIVAFFALIVSAVTFWFVHMRRGILRAGQPQSIYFGPDGGTKTLPKVYAATFLHSSGERGHIIESMFVRVKVKQTTKNFTVWVYDQAAGMRRGSGLFVGKAGFAANHHFLLPSRLDRFDWQSGDYEVSLIAQITGFSAHRILWTQTVNVTEEQAKLLRADGVGIYFDWDANRNAYDSRLDSEEEAPRNVKLASTLADALGEMPQQKFPPNNDGR